MRNLIGGADRILLAGKSLFQGCLFWHIEIWEPFCVNFTVWSFWSEYLFLGGDSSFPIAVFLPAGFGPILCGNGALQT